MEFKYDRSSALGLIANIRRTNDDVYGICVKLRQNCDDIPQNWRDNKANEFIEAIRSAVILGVESLKCQDELGNQFEAAVKKME